MKSKGMNWAIGINQNGKNCKSLILVSASNFHKTINEDYLSYKKISKRTWDILDGEKVEIVKKQFFNNIIKLLS